MIEKIFCINLDHRVDRMAAAEKQFKGHDLIVTRHPAVDGRSGGYETPGCDNYNNACTMSHIEVLKAAKAQGLKMIMIFEDDVVLHKYFVQNLEDCMRDLPAGWGMLYLGGSHRQKPEKVTENIYRVRQTLTSHGIIVRGHLFDFLISEMEKLDKPVDCSYVEAQKLFPCFVTNPPLAWQRKGYSDICHRQMDYPHLKSNEQ